MTTQTKATNETNEKTRTTNPRLAPAPSGIELGSIPQAGGRTLFRVWSPERDGIELHVVAPAERRVTMEKVDGYHEARIEAPPGTRYFFTIDGRDRPDPASRLQPEGVHGPSEVVGRDFEWHDAGWRGLPLEEHAIYELHVGTFTPEGTFDAAIGR